MLPKTVVADRRWKPARVASIFAIAVTLPALAEAATRLTTTANASGDIFSFIQNGNYAVAWDQPVPKGDSYLWGVPIDGSTAAVLLNDPSVSSAGHVAIISYKFKPDAPNAVVFHGPSTIITPTTDVYFQASVTGASAATALTPVERRIYYDARTLEPDNSYEYRVHTDANGINQVYRSPLLAGGGEIQLSNHTRTGLSIEPPKFSASGDRLLYLVDAGLPGALDLYSVPTDGSTPPVRLNPTLTSSADVSNWLTTADGSRTTFRLWDSGTGPRHLYIGPTDGSSPAQELDQSPDNELIDGWQFTPDESRVLYVTHNTTGNYTGGLYSVSMTNPQGDHFRISSNSANAYGSISNYFLTPAGDRVIFQATLNNASSTDLFSASTTQPGTQIQINTRTVADGKIFAVKLIHGAQRVVYRGDMQTHALYDLYAADTGQSGTQIRISGPVASNGGSIFGYQLSADEEFVSYVKTSPGRSPELFSASTSTADSERTLIYQDSFTATEKHLISPDSNWVVAQVTTKAQSNLTRDWLFAIPIDGGIPVRLSDPLPVRGNIGTFEFSQSGNKVLYLADVSATLQTGCSPIPGNCGPGTGATFFQGLTDLFVADLPTQAGLLGDMDGNHLLNTSDVEAFALGISSPQDFAFHYGLTPVNFGDMNHDRLFDNSDIAPFASLLGVPESSILSLIHFPGDFNSDGFVDNADYLVWRKTGGSNISYEIWRAHFGQAAGSGTGSNVNSLVPEPASLTLVVIGMLAVASLRPHKSLTTDVSNGRVDQLPGEHRR